MRSEPRFSRKARGTTGIVGNTYVFCGFRVFPAEKRDGEHGEQNPSRWRDRLRADILNAVGQGRPARAGPHPRSPAA